MIFSVIGLGYIGLPTAALLAQHTTVHGFDISDSVIQSIKNGQALLDEPGVPHLISSALQSSRLTVSTCLQSADVYIIAVPTPVVSSAQEPDLSYLFEAARSISLLLQPGQTVILESTSPVGTTQRLHDFLAQESQLSSSSFYTAYCPERVLPGNIIDELTTNPRLVGGINPESTAYALKSLSQYIPAPFTTTDSRTAELVKLLENTYRDVNLGFSNQVSMLCSELSLNPFDVIRLANNHPRVNILSPGCGVGGHCIAVDPWFLISQHTNTDLFKSARLINNKKPQFCLQEINACIDRHWPDTSFSLGVYGIAFKPDVADTRESPALSIANELSKKYSNVTVIDPLASSSSLNSTTILHPPNFDLNVVLVAHRAFKALHFDHTKTLDFCGLHS